VNAVFDLAGDVPREGVVKPVDAFEEVLLSLRAEKSLLVSILDDGDALS
jgi:hypothetical protein